MNTLNMARIEAIPTGGGTVALHLDHKTATTVANLLAESAQMLRTLACTEPMSAERHERLHREAQRAAMVAAELQSAI